MTYVRPEPAAEVNPALTIERVVGGLLVLDGSAVMTLWMLSLSSGAFGGLSGLLVYQEGNFPALHLAAEVVMGASALVSGIGLLRLQRWAPGVALVSSGMLAYSAINSAGWAFKNDPALLVPMVATLALVALAAPYLLRQIMKGSSAS